MSRYASNPEFRHDAVERVGVLVSNLGTPDDPSPRAVRRYLAQFLWDPRVVEVPRPLWWLILHGVILRIRPRRSAEAYATVWSEEGSPLLVYAQRQRDALAEMLQQSYGDAVVVELGMRYGSPSIAGALRRLRDAGATRLVVLPLYPQYSATTTASTFDAVSAELVTWRKIPELRFVNSYHDHPGYIRELAASIREHRTRHGAGRRLLFSFHGIPKRYLLAGDCYHCLCRKTARLVAAELELAPHQWEVSFQSRLGREEWLKPYTDHVLEDWGKQGLGDIDVVCPGFSADCLETLEEVALGYGELYREAGGGTLRYVPALNERPGHISFLAELIGANLQGWESVTANGGPAAAELEERKQRAVALGAAR